MKIEGGKVEPCSTCYKLRQIAKTAAGRALGRRQSAYLNVTTDKGTFVLDNKEHKIIEVGSPDWASYIGLNVYLAGKRVIDVAAAKPIGPLGQIVKAEPLG